MDALTFTASIPVAVISAICGVVGTIAKQKYDNRKRGSLCVTCAEHEKLIDRITELEKANSSVTTLLASINESIKDIRADIKLVMQSQLLERRQS